MAIAHPTPREVERRGKFVIDLVRVTYIYREMMNDEGGGGKQGVGARTVAKSTDSSLLSLMCVGLDWE